MPHSNFFNLIQHSFKKELKDNSADKIFLEGPDFSTLYYSDIEPITAKIANLFLELDIKAGARVVAQVPKSPMAVMLYLACLRSGVVFTPLNPDYTPEEVDYFLGDTAPALLICTPDKFDHLIDSIFTHSISCVLQLDELGQGSLVDRIKTISDQHDVIQVSENDLAVLIYTSGTTGKPKGAMLSHGNLASNALTLFSTWGWQHNDVLIHALPIFHVHGLFVALHLALLGGSSIKFLAKFDAKQIIPLLPQASVFMGVPTFYTRLLAEPELNTNICHSMRLFISGSAPLLKETFEGFKARTGHTILERYGMSETGMLSSNPLQNSEERIAGTVGYPLSGVNVRVCDDHGNSLDYGEIGLLHVKGPNVCQGYWRQPALAQSHYMDGYFITGDLVQIDSGGRITIVGRSSDLIISGGLNVYPKEIELALDELGSIQESAVFGVPHHDFGEAVIAAIVLKKGAKELQLDQLTRQLAHVLARHKLPKKLINLNELPRNTMGKVQKNLLRKQYIDLFNTG